MVPVFHMENKPQSLLCDPGDWGQYHQQAELQLAANCPACEFCFVLYHQRPEREKTGEKYFAGFQFTANSIYDIIIWITEEEIAYDE